MIKKLSCGRLCFVFYSKYKNTEFVDTSSDGLVS